MTALLIVGGTRGIGKEIARYYAEQGWSIVLTGRHAAHAQSAAAEVDGDTRGIALDLSEPELIADALADVGAVDHLILTAIARDTNTLDDYNIAITLKISGSSLSMTWAAFSAMSGGSLTRYRTT